VIFLEIAYKITKTVVVVTDNDGDVTSLERKYENFLGTKEKKHIKICYDKVVDTGSLLIKDKVFNYNTLEPKILKENGLAKMNLIFEKTFTDENDLHKHMKANKTECALKIFDSSVNIIFPQYILDSIS
jgi:putative ATP-dependent endonuclease of OLD family